MGERFGGMKGFENITKFILPVESYNFLNQDSFYKPFDISYINYNPFYSLQDEIDFSVSIPNIAQTVTTVSMMLAFYLGCNPIYLIGCEANWKIEKRGNIDHFYENKGWDAKSTATEELVTSCIKIIFHQYTVLHRYAKIHNKQIFNATAGGILEEYPRVRYSSLWKDLVTELSGKATQAYNNGELAKVINYIEKIERIGEFPENVFLLKGMTLAKLGNFTEAKKFCQKELECYPDNLSARQFLNIIDKQLVNY